MQYPSFAVLLLFFGLVLFWCWPVEDANFLLERLRIKLPFLLLPLTFLALPRVTERQLDLLLYFMLLLFVLTSFGIIAYYLQHFQELNLLIKQGHHIPTPRNHIRYSLLLALAIVGGYLLWEKGFYLRSKSERRWILGATVFLFFFIHLLSVKSGLLVLYSAGIALGFRYVWVNKQWLIGLSVFGLIVLVPYLSYHLIPSFKNKMHYTIHDLLMFQEGKGGQYSDSGRLASLAVGASLATAHPWTGVGVGNLRLRVQEQYELKYPDYVEPFMPQNQFLYVAAGTGVFGLGVFSFAFCFPFFYQRNYLHPLFLLFYVMTFVAFMIEHAIENAVGVAHFLFFLLVMVSHLNRES